MSGERGAATAADMRRDARKSRARDKEGPAPCQRGAAAASDCAAPENQLPITLRGQIISLAMWVARYSSEVLREGADVEPLIDINRTMMEGLGAR